MFDRIVVPLDGTHFAEAALAPARALARAYGGRILLVRAQHPSGLPVVMTRADEQTDPAQFDESDEYLHEMAEQLRRAGEDADYTLSLSEPGAGIARTAEVTHADVIVMATHLRWKIHPATGPSTTLNVLARSHVPILAWRAREDEPAATWRQDITLAGPESPLIVPLDGSAFAESALPFAEALARTFESYLVLVSAIEPAHAEHGPARPAHFTDARTAGEYLDRLRDELAGRGTHAVTVVREGSAMGITEAVWRETNGSMIVMASHGHTGILRAFLGSVAARIIEEVEAPVLVIRPEGEYPVPADDRAGASAGLPH
jgi:nucleotide-binding universal stress UspA family protein